VNSTIVQGAPEARAQELIDATTTAVFSHMSTVLSTDHRELLAFLLALDRLQATHKLSDAEMSAWMGGMVTDRLQATHKLSDAEMSAWMGGTVTDKIQSHVECVDDISPHWLSQQVAVVYFCS